MTQTRRTLRSPQKPASLPQHPLSGATVTDPDNQMDGVSYTSVSGSNGVPPASQSDNRRDSVFAGDAVLSPLKQRRLTRSAPSTPLDPRESSSSASSATAMEGLEIIAHDTNELFGAMTKLEQLGVQKSDIPIPKVVVIGDQSAGKSSLIEAMSEINVPRNAGTCTRCPVQITTSDDAEPWKCTVSLVLKYNYFGKNVPDDDEDAFIPGDFHPWVISRQPATIPFKMVHDKKELCEVIQRAQIAILHPSHEPMNYVKGRMPKTNEVEFSPNYITLDITGPGLPSLSFYDLPGVIAHTEKPEDKYLVDLVKNLVRHYVRDEHSLILLACSMETDIHTSNAFGIVRDEKAGDRCVGVLTKPDRAPEGHPVSIWNEILSGQKFALKHGYYVTKQPNQNQLGFRHKEARAMESCYFEDEEPWATELGRYKHLFGTTHLQHAISRKLALIILNTLPMIHDQLNDRLTTIDDELDGMPEVAPHNAFHIVTTCIETFHEHAQLVLRGEYPHNSFRAAWKQQKTQYRTQITALRPKYQVHSVLDAKVSRTYTSPMKGNSRDPIELEDDDRVTPCPVPATTPNRKRKAEVDNKDNVFVTPAKRMSRPPNTPLKAGPDSLNLDQIREVLESSNISGRKGTHDPKAVDRLIQGGIQYWQKPSDNLKISVEQALLKCLGEAFQGAFRQYEKTDLYSVVNDALRALLEQHLKDHAQHAERLLKHEQHAPSTENDDAYDNIRLRTQAELEAVRLKRRGQLLIDAEAVEAGKSLTDEALQAKMAKDKRRIEDALGPDPCQRELEVMAEIRAYYTVASMRYVDNITRSIEVEVFEGMRNGLKKAISAELFPPDVGDLHERCAQLLAEDQDRARRRFDLKEEKRLLEEARAVLDGVVQKHKEDPVNHVDWSKPMC